MNDEIKALRPKERFEAKAVADIQIVVGEVPGDAAEPIEIPGGITGRSEKKTWRILLSTPWSLCPCRSKCSTASEPINPLEPVTRIFIVDIV
jgi:hypothetical protein